MMLNHLGIYASLISPYLVSVDCEAAAFAALGEMPLNLVPGGSSAHAGVSSQESSKITSLIGSRRTGP
jgi:hypothetical protein